MWRYEGEVCAEGISVRAIVTAVAAMALFTPASARLDAADFTANDDASFRQAINDANIDGEASTIRLTGDITLDPAPLPTITKPLTIDSNGQTLRAENGTTGNDGEDIVFPVDSGVTLEIVDDAGGLVIGGQGAAAVASGADAGDGGIGAVLSDGNLNNSGAISGGGGGAGSVGDDAGDGGDGAFLESGDLVSNQGMITGGGGGDSSNDDGGDGGFGVFLQDGNLVSNQGTIAGGNGGGASVEEGGDGGIGGDGVHLENGDLVNNQGTISGGDGGDAPSGFGGDGGLGVHLVTPGRVGNHGTITGGDGGSGDAAGGFGVFIQGARQGGGRVDNWGTILGGAGGAGFFATGPGGAGVLIVGPGGQVHNRGLIAGGSGEGGFFIVGGHGVQLLGINGRVVNSGTIRGGKGLFNAGILMFSVSSPPQGGSSPPQEGAVVINSGLISGGTSTSASIPPPFFGGPGILFATQKALVKNSGTIQGGLGAQGSTQGSTGIFSFSNLTVINSGTISGGLADAGNGPRGRAILFGGGSNRLELRPGFEINGVVDATTEDEDTFALGGSGSDTFDIDQFDDGSGPPEQYQGFEFFEKTGPSTWTLTGSGTTSLWSIEEGTLAVNGTLDAPVSISQPGILAGTGNVIGMVTNQGIIAPGNSIGTLLIDGNYTSSGGALNIETDLNPISPSADRLLITGNVTGKTSVEIQNIGGDGLATGNGNTDGLSIVQVGGTSTADAFHLAGEYVAIGPYRYGLNAFSPGQSAGSQLDPRLGARGVGDFWDYRLQSVGVVPQIPAYQALGPAALQYGWALFDNLHQRLGEIKHVTERRGNRDTGRESFVRVRGRNGRFSGDLGPDFEQDMWFLQTGTNLIGYGLVENDDSLRLGMAFSYGRSQIGIDQQGISQAGLQLKSPALALTSTYQGAGGWYLDTIVRGSQFDAEVTTAARGEAADFNGAGFGTSVEAGCPLYLASRLILEPQIQLAYQRLWFEDFSDIDGIQVDSHDTDGLRGRIGGRLQKTFVGGRESSPALWSPYVSMNLLQGMLGGGSLTAGGVGFLTDNTSTALAFGTGLNAQLGDRWGLYSNATYFEGLADGGIAYAWTGMGGVRVNF